MSICWDRTSPDFARLNELLEQARETRAELPQTGGLLNRTSLDELDEAVKDRLLDMLFPSMVGQVGRILANDGDRLFWTTQQAASLPAAVNTGDIIRFNALTQAWETAAEPFLLNGIILSPLSSGPSEQEGTVYYSSGTKGIHVCQG